MGYTFNGDWHFDYRLPAFAGFRDTIPDAYDALTDQRGDGTISIEFADDYSEDPDPSPEQLKAFDHLIEHQYEIVDAVYKEFVVQMKKWLWEAEYEWRDEDEKPVPDVSHITPDVMKSLIGISLISINLDVEEGQSVVCISGNCDWDQEHGFGVRMVGSKVMEMGAYSDAMSDAVFGEYKPGPRELSAPHPKYGKLKPWQEGNNDAWFMECIVKGRLEDLKTYAQVNNIDFSRKWTHGENNYLSAAIQADQPEVIEYLISRGTQFWPGWQHLYGFGDLFGRQSGQLILSMMTE